jgi:hypothetical protein
MVRKRTATQIDDESATDHKKQKANRSDPEATQPQGLSVPTALEDEVRPDGTSNGSW